MKKKDLPKGTVIDHRDANSKVFVWLVIGNEKVLYGIKRLCAEHNLSFGTFWYRWKVEGMPDEVKLSTLTSPTESYAKKTQGWTVDGVWFQSTRSVATFIGRAESTISERFIELGRRHATFEELAARKPRTDTRPHSSQREAQTVLCHDGQRYTIAELAKTTGMSKRHLRRRAIEKDWIFGPHDLKRQDEVKAANKDVKPVDPVYMSPRYRHIKLGDLCHLSSRGPNTGAGKGEIPDEIWCREYGKRKAISVGRIAV